MKQSSGHVQLKHVAFSWSGSFLYIYIIFKRSRVFVSNYAHVVLPIANRANDLGYFVSVTLVLHCFHVSIFRVFSFRYLGAPLLPCFYI